MNQKNSTRFVLAFMGTLILVSAVLVWIMIGNYSKDTSKERSQLTQAHKKAMEEGFAYNPKRGEDVYNQFCLRCHGAQGQGTASAPPISGSPIVSGDSKRLVKVVNYGMKGKIERAGKVYDMVMPGFPMITHEDMAHLLTFLRSSFGHSAGEISTEEVIRVKVDNVEQKGPFQAQSLE